MTKVTLMSPKISRRKILAGGAIAGSIPLLAISVSPAEAKISQAAVAYQSSPKGNQSCSVCGHFQPPSSCKTIDGAISPNGWCKIWAQKAV